MAPELVQTVRTHAEGREKNVRREYSRNFRYFHRNHQMLMEKHPDKHIVIFDRNVFDQDKDFKALLERTIKNIYLMGFFIGYVGSPETELVL